MTLPVDKKRVYQLNWITLRRLAWIEEQGNKCAVCESTDSLEVDHIDRTKKTMHPKHIWSRRKEIRDEELKNCQVLCAPCHKAKTSKEMTTTGAIHGHLACYRRGCRCNLCRGANAARSRRQRANTPRK